MKPTVGILVGLAAVVAAFAVGQQQGHAAMITSLQVEAAGNLSQRIETLSLLRIGDTTAAIHRLETEADGPAERELGFTRAATVSRLLPACRRPSRQECGVR